MNDTDTEAFISVLQNEHMNANDFKKVLEIYLKFLFNTGKIKSYSFNSPTLSSNLLNKLTVVYNQTPLKRVDHYFKI